MNNFKSLVWDVLVEAALTALHINFWPINSIVIYVTDQLYEGLHLAFDLEKIIFINAAHKSAYTTADVTLKIIAHDKGMDSDDFKTAQLNFQKELVRFTTFHI